MSQAPCIAVFGVIDTSMEQDLTEYDLQDSIQDAITLHLRLTIMA